LIVATLNTEKGRPKILKKCKLPLTAHHEVNMIVTELAVIDVRPGGLVLREHHPDVTVEEIKSMTEADLFVSEHLKPMAI